MEQRCESCGNVYDKAFQVTVGGTIHVFDSLECAAQILAPPCASCGVRILGHGVEEGNQIFCCAHCAGTKGRTQLRDRS